MAYFVQIDTQRYEQYGEVEIVSPPVNISEVPKGNFEICRKNWMGRFVKTIGGQRGVIGETLLRKRDGQNKVLLTNRELSKETGASLTTVNNCLQDLQKADCIRCRRGVLMVNPGICHVGNRQREAFLLEVYKHFGQVSVQVI